eukprot:SAG31_NODE_438_length_15693_cov_6.254248_10_plen_180_part_00
MIQASICCTICSIILKAEAYSVSRDKSRMFLLIAVSSMTSAGDRTPRLYAAVSDSLVLIASALDAKEERSYAIRGIISPYGCHRSDAAEGRRLCKRTLRGAVRFESTRSAANARASAAFAAALEVSSIQRSMGCLRVSRQKILLCDACLHLLLLLLCVLFLDLARAYPGARVGTWYHSN